MAPSQRRHWSLTFNNYTDDDLQRWRSVGASLDGIIYFIFGKEVGAQGTKHLQGFISFSGRRTMAGVKRLLGNSVHVEDSKGSPSQNKTYCSKDGDFEEFGSCPGGQGTRTDLSEIAKAVKDGVSLKRVAEEHPESFLRYSTGIMRLRTFYPSARDSPPDIQVFWGKTGVGKTRRCYEFTDREKIWMHPGGNWFDGYDGHLVALLDDYDGSWFKIDYLLKLLDRYVFQVPVKGGYVWWNPKHIFITSNKKPEDWYPNANEEHRRALMRRLTEFGTIHHCQ